MDFKIKNQVWGFRCGASGVGLQVWGFRCGASGVGLDSVMKVKSSST
jgi:hypothetical protein